VYDEVGHEHRQFTVAASGVAGDQRLLECGVRVVVVEVPRRRAVVQGVSERHDAVADGFDAGDQFVESFRGHLERG
jgi:hypothetical protein